LFGPLWERRKRDRKSVRRMATGCPYGMNGELDPFVGVGVCEANATALLTKRVTFASVIV
jgi:hypothetical protein